MSEGWLLGLPGLILAISFHEFSHALVATKLGDPTPRLEGRLTLNPLAHLDPLGLLMLWVFRFGWARPVRVEPGYFRDPRTGMVLVALAGPGANLALAWALLVLMSALGVERGNWLYLVFEYAVIYNVWLAVFNILPIPPLDGSRVLPLFLPREYGYRYHLFEQWGWVILLLLIASGLIRIFLDPMAMGAMRLLTWLAGGRI